MVISSRVYGQLKVPKTVLAKTVKVFFSDAEKRKEYETVMKEAKAELGIQTEHKELSKE